MVWRDPKHQEPKAAFLSFHPSVSLFRLFCLHSPVSMSQSSKCDEHRRLHNAKSPSLIDDTVNTSTHTHTRWHARTHRLSHTHSRTRTLACRKTKNPCCPGTYIHRQKSPPLVTRLSSRLRIPGASCSHTPLTHTHLSFSLSLCNSLSLTHTRTDAAALTQPAREEGSKRVGGWGGGLKEK